MKEFEVKSLNKTFRIKRMNGIEALAAREVLVQIKNGKMEEAFNLMLSKYVEVQVDKDIWHICKDKDTNNYYPSGLENEVDALTQIMSEWTDYVLSFFVKSNE